MEAQEATKRCPMCGEQILAVAIKCRHCQSMIGAAPAEPVIAAPTASPPPLPAAVAPNPPTPVQLSFKPASLWFWVGSLPGLFIWATVTGSMFAREWRGGDRFAWPQTFIAFGFAAVAVALPMALVFGAAMKRSKTVSPWPTALYWATAFAAVFSFLFVGMTNALLGDRGYVANIPVFVLFAAISMFGGAVAAVKKAQGRP